MSALRHFARASALLLACYAFGAAPASSTNALAGFLAKVRAASGDPYRRHIVGTLAPSGSVSDVESSVDQDGARIIVHNCREGICTGSYFDGERTYTLDPNDTALANGPSADTFERSVRIISSYAFASPDFVRAGGTLTDRGVRRMGQHLLRAIEVRPVSGMALMALIDLRTGLLFAIVSMNEAQGYEYRDYRSVGGMMLPFEIWAGGRRVTRYATRALATTPFRAPRGLAPQFAAVRQGVQLVPKTSVPIFTCTIGSETVPCLLDTGNSGMSMSLELSEKLGLELVGSLRVSGIGQYVTGYVRGPALRVGSALFPAALYVVLHDLHRLGYDLVLGTDVLASTAAVIDYGKRELTFYPLGSTFGGSAIPLQFENFVPVANVRLGDLPVQLAIDTGDQSTVNLAYDFYEKNATLFTVKSTLGVSGIGGATEQLIGRIPSVGIGPFTLTNQKIGATRALQPTAKGHLGGGFLSHFTLFLDYARARIGLLPRADDKAVSEAP